MVEEIFSGFQEIHTERLLLREIKQEDAESIYKLRSYPEVARYEIFQPYTNIKQAGDTIKWFSDESRIKKVLLGGYP